MYTICRHALHRVRMTYQGRGIGHSGRNNPVWGRHTPRALNLSFYQHPKPSASFIKRTIQCGPDQLVCIYDTDNSLLLVFLFFPILTIHFAASGYGLNLCRVCTQHVLYIDLDPLGGVGSGLEIKSQ